MAIKPCVRALVLPCLLLLAVLAPASAHAAFTTAVDVSVRPAEGSPWSKGTLFSGEGFQVGHTTSNGWAYGRAKGGAERCGWVLISEINSTTRTDDTCGAPRSEPLGDSEHVPGGGPSERWYVICESATLHGNYGGGPGQLRSPAGTVGRGAPLGWRYTTGDGYAASVDGPTGTPRFILRSCISRTPPVTTPPPGPPPPPSSPPPPSPTPEEDLDPDGVQFVGKPVGSPLRYVALGDSYSSGEGLGEEDKGYLAGDDSACHRHRLAYPKLFTWRRRDSALNFFACTGGRTEHIYASAQRREPAPQAERTQLNKRTHLVTVTIGGNDTGEADENGNGGLSKVLSACYTKKDCQNNGDVTGKLTDNLARLRARKLPATFKAIRARTGRNTSIVVLGYPHVFPNARKHQDCAKQGFTISLSPRGPRVRVGWEPAEQNYLNAAVDRLNRLTSRVTNQTGVYFYNPVGYFKGHARCEDKARWTNGLRVRPKVLSLRPLRLSLIGDDAFHPTKEGHKGYSEFLRGQLNAEVRRIRDKKKPGRLTSVGLPPNPRPEPSNP